MAIAGRVAIVPKGDWSADATYKRLDAVTHNNTLYFAKKNVPAGTVTSNTEYWSKSIAGGASAIATTEDAGVVKPDGKSMSVDESGTLSINLDGTTITLDEAKNVIKLADALKEKIGSALQPESIVNNQVTTETGFALDARQANPNIDGTLAKQVADLNGSLKVQNNAACTLVNATGSAEYSSNGFMVQVIMEILPTQLTHGTILLSGLQSPIHTIYMTLPEHNGYNIPCILDTNGNLSVYYPLGNEQMGRIDHSFVYITQ